MEIGDTVEFITKSSNEVRRGIVIGKKYTTCNIKVKYPSGTYRIIDRKEQDLTRIKRWFEK